MNYTIEEIIKGTANFSTANIIGEGGFGIVYRAKLKDGSFVAVKRVKKKVRMRQFGSNVFLI